MGRLAVAVAAGLMAHLLLFTFTKDDSDPPVCYSLPGYVVPCGNSSYLAASGVAGVVAVVLLVRRPGGRRWGRATDERRSGSQGALGRT